MTTTRTNDSHISLRDVVEGVITRARLHSSSDAEMADAIYGTLVDYGVTGMELVIRERDGSPSDAWCEWPVRTGWRMGTCGRSGFHASERGDGIRLCWQHEDALMSELYARTRGGNLPDFFIEAVAERLVVGVDKVGMCEYVHQQVMAQINAYAAGGFLPSDVRDAVGALVGARMADVWGAA